MHARVEKKWFIHAQVDAINNPTKFQLIQKRMYNFELKLFEPALPLKCGQRY